MCRCIGDAQGAQIAAADPIVSALLLTPGVFQPFLKPVRFLKPITIEMFWTGTFLGQLWETDHFGWTFAGR